MSKGIFSRVGQTKFPRFGGDLDTLVAWLEQLFGMTRQDVDNRPCILDCQALHTQTSADLLETQLAGYTIPAGSMSNTGNYIIRVSYFGNKPNAHLSTLKLYFNGVLLQSLITSLAGIWILTDTIAITLGNFYSMSGAASAVDFTTDVLIKLTATNGTAAAGDCVFFGATLELLNPPT